jgi:hypothetical protein
MTSFQVKKKLSQALLDTVLTPLQLRMKLIRVCAVATFIGMGTGSIGTGQAQAVTIDFEPLSVPGAGLTSIGSNYSEDGFSISQDLSEPFKLTSINSGNFRFNGSTSLFNDTPDGTITLSKNDGNLFNLSSIDLDWLNGFGQVVVDFTALNSDLSTVIKSFNLDFSNGFETFSFGNSFNNIRSVSWKQASPYHQFDNIVIADANSVQPVPEPMTILGTLAAGGIGTVLRRKSMKQAKI